MKKLIRTAALLICTLAVGWCTQPAQAAEPHWSPVVIARGQQRAQIEATPIELRPYRPLHFYGNTLRRLHHRGRALPRPIDFRRTVVYALRRP
ncbi:hypothetical protein [Roseimaritima ulvae]|uniref:Uncharacterized protein n=1 Tax=Roseimaritima ulvae TaxID=980254 RepID=A0A5B9QLP2_9BACT|nr:hypothetical protein [Roseimaritima ulvae]QEG38939.1 hypothetical protein UC8_08990 [Roseimaritima ulvae]